MTLILCASSTVLSQNLLTNGSFENFTTDGDGKITNIPAMGTYNAWAVPGWAQAVIGLSDQPAKDGDKSIYFKAGGGAPIKQRVALIDGKQYRATVWIKWSEGADNKGDAQFKVDANGTSNTGGSQIAGVLLNGMETTWTEYTFEFTASGTSHEIVVYRWGLDAQNEPVGEMHVDNVVLIEVDPTSTKSILGENFNFYPNPFNDILHINNAVGIKAASITNLAGQVIIKQEINSSNDQSIINTSSLEKGVYLLQVTGKQGETQTVKLIKH